MTDYYKGLDSVSTTRYEAKLQVLGLSLKNVPYDSQNASNFMDDMTKLSRVGVWQHILLLCRQARGLHKKTAEV